MFVLITTLIRGADAIIVFYSVPLFVDYFLSLFAVETLESVVLQSLQRYLWSPVNDADVSTFCAPVTRFCTKLFASRKQLLKRIDSVPSFLATITGSLNYNRALASHFPDFAHRALGLLFLNPTNEMFISTLSLFSVVLSNIDHFGFTEPELFEIAQVLRGLEATEDGASLLCSLLAQRKSVSYETVFISRTPAVVFLVLAYGHL
jgi:hypothetical protein